MTEAEKQYADIINQSRPVSSKHPPMSMLNRAAQFSPFAALTGYDAAVREMARLTDARIEIDENTKAMLNTKLHFLLENPDTEAVFTYFQPDTKKSGGVYVHLTGFVKDIDEIKREVFLSSGIKIPVEEIIGIESTVFSRLEMD